MFSLMGLFLKKFIWSLLLILLLLTRCASFVQHYMVCNRLHRLGLPHLALQSLNLDFLLALMILRSLLATHPMVLFFSSFVLMTWLLLVMIHKPYMISNIILINILRWKTLGISTTFLVLKSFGAQTGISYQAKYASDLLVRSRITNSNTASTPLDPNVHLTPYDGVPLEDVSSKTYW